MNATTEPIRKHGAPPKYYEAIGVLDYDLDSHEIQLHRAGLPPIPVEPPADVADVALLAAEYDLGQVWIMPRCARGPLDLPAEVSQREAEPHPWARFDLTDATIQPAGGFLTRWFLVQWRTDDEESRSQPRVSIVLPHLDGDAPWHKASTPEKLIVALNLYRKSVDSQFFWSTSSTASGLASRAYPNLRYTRKATDKHPEIPPVADCSAVHNGRLPLASVVSVRDAEYREVTTGTYKCPINTQWTRPWDDQEDGAETLFAYDCNAAFLSAIGSVYVGRGEPIHCPDRDSWDRWYNSAPGLVTKLNNGMIPGYFRLMNEPQMPARLTTRLPGFRWYTPITGTPESDEPGYWVTAPILRFLKQQGIPLIVVESYLWNDSVRPYEEFAARLSRARTDLRSWSEYKDDPFSLAADAVKETYSVFYRWLGRRERFSERGLWRPDHMHAIDDLAKVNQWRRVITIGQESGRWPVAMRTDELIYASNALSHKSAAPLGMRYNRIAAGAFKPSGWCHAAPMREAQGERLWWRVWEQNAMKGELVDAQR